MPVNALCDPHTYYERICLYYIICYLVGGKKIVIVVNNRLSIMFPRQGTRLLETVSRTRPGFKTRDLFITTPVNTVDSALDPNVPESPSDGPARRKLNLIPATSDFYETLYYSSFTRRYAEFYVFV